MGQNVRGGLSHRDEELELRSVVIDDGVEILTAGTSQHAKVVEQLDRQSARFLLLATSQENAIVVLAKSRDS
jgi:hypothetical protein